VRKGLPPCLGRELLAPDNGVGAAHECDQKAEFVSGELQGVTADDSEVFVRPELQWPGHQDFCDGGFHLARRVACCARPAVTAPSTSCENPDNWLSGDRRAD
jgi:hypothetical protein